MSHSLFQQVSDLKDQLAQQKAECDAIRAECEAWKTRAEQESQEKAMLEALLKDSEQGKIEWWTKFKELQASGPGESSARKRKRTKDEMGPLGAPLDHSDDETDSVIIPASDIFDNSPGLLPETAGHEDSDEVLGAGVQTMSTAVSWPTPPDEPIKLEEEDDQLSAAAANPVRVKVEEVDDEEVQYVSGAFPTTLGDIKIKVEPGAFELPPDTVLSRFRQADAKSLEIEINPEFHAKAVTRAFLASKYGGNPNTTWCPIADTTRREKGHDIQIYFCPNVSWSPNLPRAPGLPGLFNVPSAGVEIEEMPMFVGLNVNKWVYMGHYVGVPQEPLSNEEIQSLGEKALTAWVEDMVEKRWARTIRAAVYLRLRGIEPTEEEIERALNRKTLGQVSARDIRAAYERRDELMHVVCLKPVRYDTDFQKELIDGFRVYERKMKRKKITAKSNARVRSPNSFEQGGKTGQPPINSRNT
ncbi:hypothetical protein FRC00_006835, partial [Tulasnella sp. 408]